MDTTLLIETFHTYLPQIAAALPIAIAALLVGILINLITERSLLLFARRTALSEADILPICKLARLVISLITLIVILSIFGFNLGGIWAMLSTVLAMIAIGFVAVWSMLSNVSATVLILLMRPFNIGDEIELSSEKIKGRVVDLNFFFTTLRTDENTTHQVPNNLFFQKVVTRTTNSTTVSLTEQLQKDEPASLPKS
jgi:small-conductance mechanosensitive channel